MSEEKPIEEITKPTEEITEPIEMKEEPELVSPFGLGPYPKLPEGYIDPEIFWQCQDINHELILRVHIQMIKDGTRDRYSSVGGAFLNGKMVITPIEKGSILVEYIIDANGEKKIVSAKGAPDFSAIRCGI